MKDKTLFIFDLDGTLVNSYIAIQRSLNHARKKFNHPPVDYETSKRNIGHGDRQFIEYFFKKAEVNAALHAFKKHHETAVLRYVKPIPSTRLVLHRLRQKGKRLAIATNRPKKFTHLILKQLDFHKYFDKVLCADEVKNRKPSPDLINALLKHFKLPKEAAVYVGDMDVDLLTAERARVQGVYVQGGSSSLSAVRKFRKKKTIKNLKEILTHLG